jgi:hypothetical protein
MGWLVTIYVDGGGRWARFAVPDVATARAARDLLMADDGLAGIEYVTIHASRDALRHKTFDSAYGLLNAVHVLAAQEVG